MFIDEIQAIFNRFKNLVGEHHWHKRVQLIKDVVRGNHLLRDYLFDENAIAFGLDLCSDLTRRYRQIPVFTANCRPIYPSMAFAAQVLSIIDISAPVQARQLVRRIHGALKNPDDMRALQLELVTATHFTRRGYSVAWPEMDGTGCIDLVINDLSASGLEVECKSISENKGRKIHKAEVIDFYHLMAPKLNSMGNNLRVGLAAVLTVNGRFPTAFNERKQLAHVVSKNLLSGRSVTELLGASLRVSEFDLSLLGEIGSEGVPIITRAAVDQITQTNNREAMIAGRKSGGAVVFVVQSSEDDTMLTSIFDTIAKSANKQLSKTRAGIFLVGLHGIEDESLIAIAEQDSDQNQSPTALRQHVSNFLSGQSRDHVVGVGFFSKNELKPDNAGHVISSGSAYMFAKHESPFWNDDFLGLFQ